MPGPAPKPPAALHLVRLCKVTPDVPVALPGTQVSALYLTRPHAGSAGASVVCLEGELLLDLSSGAFVHLKASEACTLAHAYRLQPARGDAAALLIAPGPLL